MRDPGALEGRARTALNLAVGGAVAAFAGLLPLWRGAWASLVMAIVTLAFWSTTQQTAPHAPAALAWGGLMLVAGLMAKGAAFRIAVDAGRPGPGGLQLGRVELNLVLVGLLTLIFLGILGLLFLVVLLCTAYAVASAGPGFVASDVMTWSGAIVGRGRVVFGAVFVAGAACMTWAATRVALAAPVTVASGELQVLKTWPLTRNRTAPMLLSAVATAALPLVVTLLLSRWSGPAADFVRATVLVGLWLPLGVGLVSYWRRILS